MQQSQSAAGTSITITQTSPAHQSLEQGENETSPRMVVRAESQPLPVRWADSVIDNEHANKKKSKICCIYHKPKKFGESSDSETESDEEDGKKNAYERQPKYTKKKGQQHSKDCQHSRS